MSGYGFGRPETSGFSSPPLLFGIEFSDGTFASNMPGGRRMHGGLSNGRTGHGAPRHFEVTLRLDHLPPAGPFTVVTAWPFYEVPEARVVFDAAVILAAADDAERLWESATADVDWERPRLTADEQLLVMPLTGWFAERFDPTPPPPKFDEHGNEIRYVPVIVDEQGNCTEVTPVRGWRMARDDE
ncbi:hypothetical protein HH308_16390 [Gordonia sp. TBRC 11910]|uniref:Uncharacterized protein n=1 Tax=Gordonia asplenii TaxID=2725283 RepID=A0A848KX22_9ACTN|nr:hypothetical protein [Gordonia asplenii]NMO02792.1 hypothetical protein [Gordonia asplenii]